MKEYLTKRITATPNWEELTASLNNEVSPMLIDKVSTGLCIIKIEYILTRCQNICIIHLDTKSEYK